jgi:cytochrome c553
MNRFRRLALAFCALTAGIVAVASCEAVSHRAAAPPSAADRGGKIYKQYCAACHAGEGTGDSFRAVPALAGQRVEYLRRQIDSFSSDERHSSDMRWAFRQVSMNTPQAAADVVSYISQLPAPKFGEADLRFEAEGKATFVARCAGCHGMDTLGSPDGTIPSLRAQNDSYLLSRLRRFAAQGPALGVSAHAMDEHDIVAISSYLSSLKGLSAVRE